MKNPITEVREGLGLSRRDFAVMVGVSYYTLWNCESGYDKTVPHKIAQFCEENTGVKDIQILYLNWLEDFREAIKIQAGLIKGED